MFRSLIAAVLLLFLSGCFESDNPKFPRRELVQPADLLGYRWSVSGATGEPALHSFRKGKNGSILWYGDWKGEGPLTAQLVRLAKGGVYLFVLDANQEKVNYTLLERWSPGVWTYHDIDLNDDKPFSDQNLAYASAVAARHGLKLEGGGESHRIVGPISASRVLGLFRDPDFLGILKLGERSYFLPAQRTRGRIGNLLIGDTTVRGAVSLFLKNGKLTDLVRPEGLAGHFVAFTRGSTSSPAQVEVKARADGWFAVTSESGARVALALLPFDEHGGVYLAVRDRIYGESEQPKHDYSLGMLSRENYGWSLQDLALLPHEARPAIRAMRSSLLVRAAAAHGMVWDVDNLNPGWSVLRQVEDGRDLLALLRDGQFTSALVVDNTMVEHFYSADALRSTIAGQ